MDDDRPTFVFNTHAERIDTQMQGEITVNGAVASTARIEAAIAELLAELRTREQTPEVTTAVATLDDARVDVERGDPAAAQGRIGVLLDGTARALGIVETIKSLLGM